ncbi:polyketide synthase dehydratase domain-containing protein [Xenorhabdus sp. KJ12.1]|uniref:polyketide synthase dehydratase domain-containing protein n=1 Tax=Xenorhabdus sp. KJ12.1 TaxID=1851571 RepID=UPI000C03D155|nr:polyketide synthase dehydratase domain-containing protein [Xenorhabdus sp. KJ12.1]PHM67148.1 polyketide synthase [Xenorhabdus sp. KJ12.1]
MTKFFREDTLWQALPDNNGYLVTISCKHVYFTDHQVRGRQVLPGVVFLELALIGAAKLFPNHTPCKIEEVAWLRPIICEGKEAKIQVLFSLETKLRLVFRINHGEVTCGFGCICFDNAEGIEHPTVQLTVRDRLIPHKNNQFSHHEIYQAFTRMGIVYGKYFRRINYVQRNTKTSMSWLSSDDGILMGWSSLMDCAFQSGMAISLGEHNDSLMPYSLGYLILHKTLPLNAQQHAFVLTEKLSPFRTNITIFTEKFNPVLSVFELGVKPSNLK